MLLLHGRTSPIPIFSRWSFLSHLTHFSLDSDKNKESLFVFIKQTHPNSQRQKSVQNLHLAIFWRRPPGWIPLIPTLLWYQTLLFPVVASELLCRQHQTLLCPALLGILFAREEFPICLAEWSHGDAELICNNNKKYHLWHCSLVFVWHNSFHKYFIPILLTA